MKSKRISLDSAFEKIVDLQYKIPDTLSHSDWSKAQLEADVAIAIYYLEKRNARILDFYAGKLIGGARMQNIILNRRRCVAIGTVTE